MNDQLKIINAVQCHIRNLENNLKQVESSLSDPNTPQITFNLVKSLKAEILDYKSLLVRLENE